MTGTKGKSGGKREGAGRKSGRYPLQLLKIACTDRELEEIIKAIGDTRLRAEILLASTYNDEGETWKPIPGFPGYEVSDKGRVKSFKKKSVRILVPSTDPNGYSCHNLSVGGKQFQVRVHRLVMLAFVGPRPEGMEICHKDGSRTNNRLDNLRYDTHLGNMKDRILHDRKGKLTVEQGRQLRLKARESRNKTIEVIRTEYAVGPMTLAELGRKNDLTMDAVSKIVRGLRYKDAGGPIKGIDY